MKQRIPHNKFGVWTKEYRELNKDVNSSRYSLDSSSFLVYTLSVFKDGFNNIDFKTSTDIPRDGLVEIHFGQHFVPQRNLQLFTKFYYDYDLSINKVGELNTNQESDLERLNLLLKRDSVSDFIDRIKGNKEIGSIDFDLSSAFTWYVGYSRVVGYKPYTTHVSNYNAITTDVFANLDDSCFEWLELKDGYYKEELTEQQKESFSMILDYKVIVDIEKLKQLIQDKITVNGVEKLTEYFDGNSVDFNFIFHPVVKNGLQFEDLPTVVKPLGILKTRLLKDVEFEISRSLVLNSQKVFEIIFEDKNTKEELYKDSSLESHFRFIITDSKGSQRLTKQEINNSYFENISKTQFPSTKFTLKYEIPLDVIKFLSEHLNYTITLKVTDLTSERV